MPNEMSLGIILDVVHDADCSGVVNHGVSVLGVPDVVSAVFAAVSIDVV